MTPEQLARLNELAEANDKHGDLSIAESYELNELAAMADSEGVTA